jgi:voltage-gated potassium channel
VARIQAIKYRLFQIIEKASSDDKLSRIFDFFILTLITLNVLCIMIETVEPIGKAYRLFFDNFELFSIIIFTCEYLLRIWTCTCNKKYNHPIYGRIKFAFTPLILIDLIAILPFYLPLFIIMDLRFMRAFRLFRVFRLFKIGRYSDAMKTFGKVLNAKKEELGITFFIIMILLIVCSSIMYFAENEAQPHAFSSIPAAMWWGVSTLTTVGYGDIYPVTFIGKFFGSIIALLGIGMFALPAGILGSGFVNELRKRHSKYITCPKCGQKIDASM